MRTKIAVPMGDPAGVGAEIIVKTNCYLILTKIPAYAGMTEL